MDEFAVARTKMVRRQLAARGIRDMRVLDVMDTVPRHLFVSDAIIPALQLQSVGLVKLLALSDLGDILGKKGRQQVLTTGPVDTVEYKFFGCHSF